MSPLSSGQAVDVLAALAQTARLDIVRLLVRAGDAGLPAGIVADRLGLTPSNLSFHMATLERAGLVHARRDGRSILYACRIEVVEALAAFLLADCCAGVETAPALPVTPTRSGPKRQAR